MKTWTIIWNLSIKQFHAMIPCPQTCPSEFFIGNNLKVLGYIFKCDKSEASNLEKNSFTISSQVPFDSPTTIKKVPSEKAVNYS